MSNPCSSCGRPTYSGNIEDDFDDFQSRFLAFVRVTYGISANDASRQDQMLLCLPSDTAASAYFLSLKEGSFEDKCALLKAHFATDARLQAKRLSAINKLCLRSFRDGSENQAEMVCSLVHDLEKLFVVGEINEEIEKRTYLESAFKEFPICLRLLKASTSYNMAVAEALRWENLVIQRALRAQSQAVSGDEKAKARLSSLQKVDVCRAESPIQARETPRNQTLSLDRPLSMTLPDSAAPNPPAQSLSISTDCDTFGRSSFQAASKLSESEPQSSQATNLDLNPVKAQTHDKAIANATPRCGSPTARSVPSISHPLKGLPPDHPYLRIKPIAFPSEFRSHFKLAAVTPVDSTFTANEETASDDQSFVSTEETIDKVTTMVKHPRKLRRKSDADRLLRKNSKGGSFSLSKLGHKIKSSSISLRSAQSVDYLPQ